MKAISNQPWLQHRSGRIFGLAAAGIVLAAIVVAVWILQSDDTQRPAKSAPPNAVSAAASATSHPVAEVIANIKAQKVGHHTVGDYHLPEDFLRGLADRIIMQSFEERFRSVVEDGSAPSPSVLEHTNPNDTIAEPIRLLEREPPATVREYRARLSESRPPLHGYRAPLLENAGDPWPFDPPAQNAPESIRRAAQLVGRGLAQDGLASTFFGALEMLANAGGDHQTLRAVGLPTDLFGFFQIDDAFIENVRRRLARGAARQSLEIDVQARVFRFAPSAPGFRVATESGEHEIDSVRLQLTSGDYWAGVGDGGNIDLARQLVENLPDASFLASIGRRHVDKFQLTAASWPWRREHQMTLVVEDLPVAQWAQDNGKFGFVDDGRGGMQPVLLVPRFASRGEDGSIFVPGETFLLDGLTAAGIRAVQSPLLFQGGNLLAVRDPKSGARLLLIGEAEIHRNTVLGLTPDQVKQAFQIEFGVDRCEIMSAVSFHIDEDLTVRSHDGRLIAFVNDTAGAVKIILECALDAMQSHELIAAAAAQEVRIALRAERWDEVISLLGPIFDLARPFTRAFAENFSVGPVDSGVGNLHRILLALDWAASCGLRLEGMEEGNPLRTYLGALVRRDDAQGRLHGLLAALGFEVVNVPGLPGAARGINYVNGIHARDGNEGVYLMPAWGGLFSRLDDAARAVIAEKLGAGNEAPAMRVQPLLCAESQRRVGAIHCSCSVQYRAPM